MKIGFVTCVQLGLSCMETIYEEGYALNHIFTLLDDLATTKSGRIFVDQFAAQHDVPVVKLRHVNDEEAVREFRQLDWLFIVGWSQIAGRDVIRAPKKGALGIHPTLLPVGRGRAAVPWAILKRLEKTGVTLFKLDEGVDTGPILDQVEIPLANNTTAHDLYEKVNQVHIELIRKVLPQMAADNVTFTEQDESRATVWPGRRPEDGEIDFTGSVYEAERLIRAVTRPYPGAYYFDSTGRKIVVWAAELSSTRSGPTCLEFHDGFLKVLELE